jgi:patatin-like phospholipase/acyl hydrolase
MTIEILLKLEGDLRDTLHKPDLVLSDYFDLISGTSTGAIVASCLSAGMSMKEIKCFYVDSGDAMFDKAYFWKRFKYKYEDEALAQKIREVLNVALGYDKDAKPVLLGDKNLKTLLMMVMKNHTTDSPWPVTNNPHAKYNNRERKDCNLNLPLWQLVRASTAAPTYFPPEVVKFAKGTADEWEFIFVDGGITSYNNPSFLAFQMATAKPYGINWETGVDKLLIVSVGTGSAPQVQLEMNENKMHLIHSATTVPTSLMNASSAGWDMACRTLGYCRFGAEIDREFGSMVSKEGESNWTGEKLFSYLRYDPDVSKKGLNELGLSDINPENIQELDAIEYMSQMQEVGKRYADKYVSLEHLGAFI